MGENGCQGEGQGSKLLTSATSTKSHPNCTSQFKSAARMLNAVKIRAQYGKRKMEIEKRGEVKESREGKRWKDGKGGGDDGKRGTVGGIFLGKAL
ncbi:hypothetical protein V5O48_017397 [Marasmius crinis-equi]|uniref:Uncharacterized protein n=1 Tax=Marasmius crinis-equi TaxID=585013 RepID=A0ABR3EP22_9AGAR